MNYRLERLRLKQRGLQLEGNNSEANLALLDNDRRSCSEEYKRLEEELAGL